jgi:hypothetical protein
MGKETVLVRESPGFITTRVNASLGNEAFYLLLEGVASARDIGWSSTSMPADWDGRWAGVCTITEPLSFVPAERGP